jgi:hypothetical protein
LTKFLRTLVPICIAGSLSLVVAAPRPGRAGGQSDPSLVSHPAPLEFWGRLAVKDGKFLLTDPKTKASVELRGTELEKFAGKAVFVSGDAIAGATPAPGAAQVIAVLAIETVASHRKAAALAGGIGAAGAGGAAAAGTTAGLSVGVLTGIGVAAAAGGTVGGLYASGTIGDDQPASRP